MHSLPVVLTPFVGILIAVLTFASSRIRHQTIGKPTTIGFLFTLHT